MKCDVLRSSLRDFTYIYLAAGQAFEDLPTALRKVFGEPTVVMSLELSTERQLAREDVNEVMRNLSEQGYHLQMPPQEDTTGLLELPPQQH